MYKPIYLYLRDIRKVSPKKLEEFLIFYYDYKLTDDKKQIDLFLKINYPMNANMFHYICEYFAKKDSIVEKTFTRIKKKENELFNEYKRYIYYLFNHKFFLNRRDYADALYEAYLSFISCIFKYDKKKGEFRNYLYSYIRNVYLIYVNRFKKTEREVSIYSCNEENIMLIDTLYDENINDFTEDCIEKEKKKEINDYIKFLTPLEQEVIKRKYGFDCDIMSNHEIGEELNYTRQNIFLIERNALLKLKELLEGGND
jgi:RNA polymerase sigma factor (sigma-70 family)